MNMRKYVIGVAVSVLLFFAATGFTQDATPTLTEVQKLQFQSLSQRIEIAQLKAQLAQKEFDAARGEISRMVEQLKVEGYMLDLTNLTYVPTPKGQKAP